MTRCPTCKEPVSQFAAGCAVCGTDLEAARRERAGRRQLPRPRLPSVPEDLVVLVLMVLVTLAAPLVGAVLTFLAIRRARASHQGPLRVALWVVLAAAVAFLLLPQLRYGVFLL